MKLRLRERENKRWGNSSPVQLIQFIFYPRTILLFPYY